MNNAIRALVGCALVVYALISALMILIYPHAWAPLTGLAVFLLVMGVVILPPRRQR